MSDWVDVKLPELIQKIIRYAVLVSGKEVIDKGCSIFQVAERV